MIARTRIIQCVGLFAACWASSASADDLSAPVRAAAAVLADSATVRTAQTTAPAPAPAVAANAAGDLAAGAGAAAEPGNLWTFLGFPNKKEMAACKDAIKLTPLAKAVDAVKKPLCTVMGLVPGPPPLEAPANLKSPVPAIKAAAKIKEEENLAPAKIQALKYLATIGCGCYPDVKAAFLAALDDCNEKVRLAAVEAIIDAECCDVDIVKKLYEMSYGTADKHKEGSKKVRKALKEALEICGCAVAPVESQERETPEPAPPADREGPMARLVPNRWGRRHAAEHARAVPSFEESVPVIEEPEDVERLMPQGRAAVGYAGGRREATPLRRPYPSRGATLVQPETVPVPELAAMEQYAETVAGEVALEGLISYVDARNGLVRLQLSDASAAGEGQRLKVFHKYPLKTAHVGDVQIVSVGGDEVVARPVRGTSLRRISRGDRVAVQ